MSASISIEQYMIASYRPDCEYLEGVLVSRRGGESRHSRIQAVVASRLNSKEQQWGMIVLIAPRVQVSPTRVRIPDLALADDLDETSPPVLAIEIFRGHIPRDRPSVFGVSGELPHLLRVLRALRTESFHSSRCLSL
jgi:Putative restriction endonuclease